PGPKPGALPGYATPRKTVKYTCLARKGQFGSFLLYREDTDETSIGPHLSYYCRSMPDAGRTACLARSLHKRNDYGWTQNFPTQRCKRLYVHPDLVSLPHHAQRPPRIWDFYKPSR